MTPSYMKPNVISLSVRQKTVNSISDIPNGASPKTKSYLEYKHFSFFNSDLYYRHSMNFHSNK